MRGRGDYSSSLITQRATSKQIASDVDEYLISKIIIIPVFYVGVGMIIRADKGKSAQVGEESRL